MNSLWTIALVFLLPLVVAAVSGVLYVRWSELAQLRCWAREDGLPLTERRELAAHYRARRLWR